MLSLSGVRVTRYTLSRLGPELLTTIHVVAMLGVVEALIRWVPLPRLSGLLGCPVDIASSPGVADPLVPAELPRRARRQLRCARRAADVWPLSRGPCLRRALVGGHLVRRLGPTVRLGTHLDAVELVGHAWIEIGGRPLEDVTAYSIFEMPSRASERQQSAKGVE